MLSTEIPASVWRGSKMKEKLVGQYDKEKNNFLDTPDTNFQPSLDVMLPETKKFPYANKVSDFGLNDKISDKKFRFESVNNNILLGEQLPDDRPFKFSLGIKGVNDHFDSMAPNKDYRYTDPQFYQYRLNGMTQQKIIESRWRNPVGSEVNPEDLDATARAVAYAEQYRKSKLPKVSAPVEGREYAPVERSDSGSGNPNTNLINALKPYQSNPASAKNSPNNSKPSSRRNSDSALDLTGSKVVDQMEQLEKGGINIEPAKMRKGTEIFKNIKNRKDKTKKNINALQTYASEVGRNSLTKKEIENERRENKDMNHHDKNRHNNKDRTLQNEALNKLNRVYNDHKPDKKSSFVRFKEQIQKHKEQVPNFKPANQNPPPKETASTPKKGDKKQEAKQPEAPSKKEPSKLNLFASATAQSFTPSQRNQAINSALKGLQNEFKTQAESLIGAKGAERFLEYGLTVNGNSKWSTAKTLLEGQLSKVEELINKGGRKNEMDKIFEPVLGAKGGGKAKISSNVLFDDKVNSMGFEPPTPEQSRALSKVSDGKKSK